MTVRPAEPPWAIAGIVSSWSDRRVFTGWTRKPSATSPATAVIRGPKPAVKIGGGPNGLGPGSNAGIIRVWV